MCRIPTNRGARDETKRKVRDELFAEIKDIIKTDCDMKDRNLKSGSSTTHCESDKTIGTDLCSQLKKYEDEIKENLAFKYDDKLLGEIRDNIKCIKSAWKNYQEGNIEDATKQIEKIIENYKDDDFFVSELKITYGIKQVAGYGELKDENPDYSEMEQHTITLYRGRISEEKLTDRKQMLHRPYKSDEKILRQRFTCEGMPALYLATTSYTCWLELGQPKENFYVSAFEPDGNGEKLKILNLAITQDLANGICMYGDNSDRRQEIERKIRSLMPLVYATSYKTQEQKEDKKEYIIPELVMRSLKKYKIDGIAYLSKHLDHDLQMQIGVNIVLPIDCDKNLSQGYGELTKYFKLTKPKLYEENMVDQYKKYNGSSLVYDTNIKKEEDDQVTINSKDHCKKYINTTFAKFDNYLVNQELKYFDE